MPSWSVVECLLGYLLSIIVCVCVRSGLLAEPWCGTSSIVLRSPRRRIGLRFLRVVVSLAVSFVAEFILVEPCRDFLLKYAQATPGSLHDQVIRCSILACNPVLDLGRTFLPENVSVPQEIIFEIISETAFLHGDCAKLIQKRGPPWAPWVPWAPWAPGAPWAQGAPWAPWAIQN